MWFSKEATPQSFISGDYKGDGWTGKMVGLGLVPPERKETTQTRKKLSAGLAFKALKYSCLQEGNNNFIKCMTWSSWAPKQIFSKAETIFKRTQFRKSRDHLLNFPSTTHEETEAQRDWSLAKFTQKVATPGLKPVSASGPHLAGNTPPLSLLTPILNFLNWFSTFPTHFGVGGVFGTNITINITINNGMASLKMIICFSCKYHTSICFYILPNSRKLQSHCDD